MCGKLKWPHRAFLRMQFVEGEIAAHGDHVIRQGLSQFIVLDA